MEIAVARPVVRPSGIAAAALMAAGLGWTGGTFAPPGAPWTAQAAVGAAHAVPVAVVVLALAGLVAGHRAAPVALTAVACGIKAMTLFAIAWGLTHPGGFGPVGLADWIPIGMANAGGGLWLRSVLWPRRAGGG